MIESTLKLGQGDVVFVKSTNGGKGFYNVSAGNGNGSSTYATSFSGSLLQELNY